MHHEKLNKGCYRGVIKNTVDVMQNKGCYRGMKNAIDVIQNLG